MKRLCSLFLCIWGAITILFRNIFLLFFRKKSSATVRLKRVWKNSKKFSKKWKKEKKDMLFRVKDTVDENYFTPPFLQKQPCFSLKHRKKHVIFPVSRHIWKNCVSPWYTSFRGGGCTGGQQVGYVKVVRKGKIAKIPQGLFPADNWEMSHKNF